MMQDIPFMALRRSTIYFLRLSNSAFITGRKSWGPRSASSAAFCEMDVGFDVLWLWMLAMAVMTSLGPAAKPMRQPVMAWDLDTPFTTMVRSLISGPRDAML